METVLNEDGQPATEPERQQVVVKNGNTAVAAIGPIAGGAAQLMGALVQASLGGVPEQRIEFIEKMYERARDYEAKMAFHRAMAKAKAEMPLIKKTKHVGFKSKKQGAADTSYTHEDLADVIRITDPVIGKYGLSSTFKISNAINQPVSVTCIISHEGGHEDASNTLVAGKDDSGNKNAIQQVSSTITYLKRYTLMAALGLAAEDDDDDGRSSEVEETLSSAQVQEITKLLSDAGGNLAKFLQGQGGFESLEEVPAGRYTFLKQEIARGVKVRADKAAAEEKAREDAMRGQEEISNTRANVERAKPGTML